MMITSRPGLSSSGPVRSSSSRTGSWSSLGELVNARILHGNECLWDADNVISPNNQASGSTRRCRCPCRKAGLSVVEIHSVSRGHGASRHGVISLRHPQEIGIDVQRIGSATRSGVGGGTAQADAAGLDLILADDIDQGALGMGGLGMAQHVEDVIRADGLPVAA